MIAVGYRGSGAGVKVYLDELQLFGGHAEGDELYSVEGVIGLAFSDSIGGVNRNVLRGRGWQRRPLRRGRR